MDSFNSLDGQSSDSMPAESFVNTYLLNGGSNDMVVDGSITPVVFSYTPPAGFQLIIGRFLLYIEGATNFSSLDFANKPVLTNGVGIKASSNVTAATWKDNVDMVTSFYDALGYPAFSNTSRSISGRWTSNSASGRGIQSDIVSAIVNDDLTGAPTINVFRTVVQGRLIPT